VARGPRRWAGVFSGIVRPSLREPAIQTTTGFEKLVVLDRPGCSAWRGVNLGPVKVSFSFTFRLGRRMVGTRSGCLLLDFPAVQPGAKRCKTDRRLLY